MRKTLSIILILLLNQVYAQTIITGTGTISGTWDAPGSPYMIMGDVLVSDLTIEAGVDVVFTGNYFFEVQNSLTAIGTVTDSIRFTVADTSGYYNNSHYGYSGFGQFATYDFQYCIFEYSKYAIYLDADGDISDCTIRYNDAGVYASQSGDNLFKNLKIESNRGGGINIISGSGIGTLSIINCMITGNEGGGIWVGVSANVSIDSCIIAQNTKGIATANQSNTIITNTLIEDNNHPGGKGGGIEIYGNCAVSNCIIRNNTAKHGAGIYCEAQADEVASIDQTLFESNTAIENGGGIYITDGAEVGNCEFKSNEALNGGAAFILDYESIGFDNNIFHGNLVINNSATNYGGGIFFTGATGCMVDHTTFCNNSAGISGGGIYNEMAWAEPIEVENCILWENLPDEIDDPAGFLNVNYSNVLGAYPGTGNINTNPLFVSPENNDFNLCWINYPNMDYTMSPCIDTGNPVSDPDPDGTVADMGAFPFDQSAFNPYYLNLKVFLEGPFAGSFMNTNLINNGYLPVPQTYNTTPWYHAGNESLTNLPNPDIVDWLFIEIRKHEDVFKPDPKTAKVRQAVVLLNNGSVKAMDGGSLPTFKVNQTDSLYLMVFHRNHLPVVSALPLDFSTSIVSFDFTTSGSTVLSLAGSQKELAPGIWGMLAADGNSDYQIDNNDKDDIWSSQFGSTGFLSGDFNMDGQVTLDDLNETWEENAGIGSALQLPLENPF